MNVDKINKAVKAANEFLNRVDAIARKECLDKRVDWVHGSPVFHAPHGKESAELRRQSMELTRALAEMRKAG